MSNAYEEVTEYLNLNSQTAARNAKVQQIKDELVAEIHPLEGLIGSLVRADNYPEDY